METSAKTRQNVDLAFFTAVRSTREFRAPANTVASATKPGFLSKLFGKKAAAPAAVAVAEVEEEKLVGKTHRVPMSNPNAMVLRLGELAQERGLATGEACFCGGGCGAVLSAKSVVSSDKWKCEFCGHETVVDLHEEERPKEGL